MTKELRCADVVGDCPEVIEGQDELEVMSKAAEHARSAHNVPTMTSDLERKVRDAIRDKD